MTTVRRPIRPFRPFRHVALVLAVGIATAGCSTGAAPATDAATGPAGTTIPASAPAATLPPDLGTPPRVAYPAVQALGIATLTLDRPSTAPVRFWLTCEWSDTSAVTYLYPGALEVLGEELVLELSITDPFVAFLRSGRAPYVGGPDTKVTVEQPGDGSVAAIRFERLPLSPEAWGPGPLPTPKAAYERPLGGDPQAAELDGTVAWECGDRPATVPTPGPSVPPEPDPSYVIPPLPNATVRSGDEVAVGVPGCGVSWEANGTGGADSCGPSYQVLDEGRAVHAVEGGSLTFTLPAGYRFTSWWLGYVEQTEAAYYRGDEPPGMRPAGGDEDVDTASVTVLAPPPGDWSVRFVFSAFDGTVRVQGQPDYYRVIVGP